MAECTQDAFLSRVRQAIGHRGEPIPLPDPREIARVIKPGTDVVELFLRRVEESKMQAHRVADEAALADRIGEIAAKVSAQTALVPEEDMPGREQIVSGLKEKGVQLADVNDRDAAFPRTWGSPGWPARSRRPRRSS